MEFVRKDRIKIVPEEFKGIESIIGKENTKLIVKRVGHMIGRIDNDLIGGFLGKFKEGYAIFDQDYSFKSDLDRKNFYNAKAKYKFFLDMLSIENENNLNM